MKIPPFAALCPLLAFGPVADISAQPSGPPGVVQQPGIPGPWEAVTPQPMPPLAETLARPGPGRLVYGLYAWGGEYHKHRESIRSVGWPSLRIAGPFDDALMQALIEDEKTVMVTLENRLLSAVQGRDRTAYASDEAFLADCKEKMLGFLDRYGPGGAFFATHPGLPVHPIREVEVWNEPNFFYLIPSDKRPLAEQEADRTKLYVKLLREVCPAIRDKHPDVTVAAFSGGGMSAGDLRFIKGAHADNPGLSAQYDVLSTHPYVRPAPPEANLIEPWGTYSIARSLASLRATLSGDESPQKPVWITEIGWPVSQADGGRFPTPADKTYVSPLLQAAYVCRNYALALRLGVERVHVMFTVDTDNFNAGFFLQDGSWRPAAFAVQTMIRQLPDPRLTGAISDGKNGFFAYTFAPDSRSPDAGRTIMAWNVNGPLAVRLPVSGKSARITDMFGHSANVDATEGKITLTVGPCPVYVTASD